MSDEMTDFETKLATLVLAEIVDAQTDPGRLASMIENLITSAGMAAAVLSDHDGSDMQAVLVASSEWLFEAAADHRANLAGLNRLVQ